MAGLGALFDDAQRALIDVIDRAASQSGIAVFVVRVSPPPMIIVYASEMLAQVVGRRLDEILGREPWELVGAADRDRVRLLLGARGPGAPPITEETYITRLDGSRRSLEVGTSRMQTPGAELSLSFVRDVTEQRAAVAALKLSEARFRSIVEHAPDGVVLLVRGRIALANPVAARLLGAEPAALPGTSVASYLPPEDGARAAERMMRIARGEVLGPSQYGVLADRERSVEIHSIPCEWEGGPAILAFARDVTDRKRLQLELDRASRLAAVGTMAAAVAHEINNPLTYVQLSLQRLERELGALGASDAAREHVRNAMHGTERVAAIVRDLRGFARDDDARPRAVELAELVERALKMVEHELKHRARLTRRFEPGLPTVDAVAGRLEQVVVNLLLNAIQALPAGDPTRDEITVELRPRGPGEVELVVGDTGVGISDADRERVFEPFFTTKPPGEGTGLGLAVCKRIVDGMRGRIAIDSGPAGTRVTVVLPAQAAVAAVVEPAPAPVAGQRLRVLVIDDEPLIRKVVAMALAPHHDVVEAAGGEAALAELARGTFDVILCDVMMPGMNGREVHNRIRAAHPGLERRIVLVTGGAFAPRLAEFLAAADNLKLEKPFTEAAVLAAVAAAAAR
jgi:PAS domain S-box-containing protein